MNTKKILMGIFFILNIITHSRAAMITWPYVYKVGPASQYYEASVAVGNIFVDDKLADTKLMDMPDFADKCDADYWGGTHCRLAIFTIHTTDGTGTGLPTFISPNDINGAWTLRELSSHVGNITGSFSQAGGTQHVYPKDVCFGVVLHHIGLYNRFWTPPSMSGACLFPMPSNETCSFKNASVDIPFGDIAKKSAAGAKAENSVNLSCTAAMNISFQSVNGTSSIPLSNGMQAGLKINNQELSATHAVPSGISALKITATLEGTPTEGAFSGSAPLVVNYQ
ncbi:hypothetical protein [Pantoea brenneri]|uniref:MrpH family fimbial adhesin n=1 Tax=Pantoea brenneri TaxID=472694 RepID=UPI00289ECB28|nr:hypothetical protein [Pantoea brenneri]